MKYENETKKTLLDEYFKKPETENMSIFDAVIYLSENMNGEKKRGFDMRESERDSGIDTPEISLEDQKKLVIKVSEYLETNEIQTLIFCGLFFFEEAVSMERVAVSKLSMNPRLIVRYKDDIQKMVDRGLICESMSMEHFGRSIEKEYFIPKNVLDCIVLNKNLELEPPSKNKDVYSFLDEIDSVFDRNRPMRFNNNAEIKFLEQKYKDEKFIKNLKKNVPGETERFILYMLAAARVQDLNVALGILIRYFYSGIEKTKVRQNFLLGKHNLQEKKFVELDKSEFADKAEITISKTALEFFVGKDAESFLKKGEENSDFLSPEKITEKELFYSDDTQNQMNKIYNALDGNNFIALQERLEKKGMHTGVAVLLYGDPGTGKTESVLQIAKKTGRAVYKVDISETKTKWFGESEKLTKKIFTDYKNECEKARTEKRPLPILFLNEADAVISKRRNIGDSASGTGQTENAIQNIFLEEIENLEGILIATTNLAVNMDSAFDRRFLFKVKFEKPEIEARAKIWKNKLSTLSDNDAFILASKYEFSGGQIDNIARKIEIDEVISGVTPEIASIIDMCNHEVLENYKTERKVGFCA